MKYIETELGIFGFIVNRYDNGQVYRVSKNGNSITVGENIFVKSKIDHNIKTEYEILDIHITPRGMQLTLKFHRTSGSLMLEDEFWNRIIFNKNDYSVELI